jgi:hypothetical protein
MTNKRIFVYLEDAPVDRDVVAQGFSRAAPAILRSVRDHIAGIAIYQVRKRFHESEFDRDLVHLCNSLPRIPTTLCKILRRYPVLNTVIADTIPARLLAPPIRKSRADTLLCFVGADIGTLTRSAKLAALAGKSYAFYMVDDFVLPLRLAGMNEADIQKAMEKARAALCGASHVFTITDGLGRLLRETYGVSPTTLHLAFEPAPRPIVPSIDQIIFVGGINFLYADGLRDLFKAVARVRLTSGADLTVRLTVPAKVATRELGELPPFVISAPVASSEGLAREIASSLLSFLPYSFDRRHKSMVSTSFPSKSMEYLAYARSIVVYGPDYGVATQCFRDASLPSVVSSSAELEEVMNTHLSVRPEYSERYRNYLVKEYSRAAARSTLCTDLDLKSVSDCHA